MGLCFSRACLVLRFGVTRVGCGDPICSRAAAFIALLARNTSRFFFGGTLFPVLFKLNSLIMQ